MIHKKSCFGRTFEQDTQASDPDGKSWSDDKFYENLRTRKETAQAQDGQGKKQGAMPSALNNAFKKLSDLNSGPNDEYIFMRIDPRYSKIHGNHLTDD
jgi:hypothetical protein